MEYKSLCNEEECSAKVIFTQEYLKNIRKMKKKQ